MAGIGFSLRKFVDKGGGVSTAGAYAYAALLASGPWLVAVVSLAFFGLIADSLLPEVDREAFFSVVCYVFAFSLILTGPLQLVVTRYVSDRLYEKDRSKVMPALWGATALAAALSASLAVPVLWSMDLTLAQRLIILSFFVTVSCLWISVVLLSAVKAYFTVTGAFSNSR